MNGTRLYHVEFGDPEQERDFWGGSSGKINPVYVAAPSHIKAAEKAEKWLSEKKAEMLKNLVTEDGLKDTDKIKNICIVTVKILADEHLIW